MRKVLFILTLLTFGLCAAAFSDVIYLKSGGRVSGEIINETEEEIKIKTTIATITIMKDQIDEIEVEKGDEGAGQAEPEVVKPEIESKDTKELSFAEKIILARAPLKEKIHFLKQELETARTSLPKEIEQAKAPLQEKIKSLEGELEKARVSIPKEIKQAKAPLQQEIDLLKKEREDLFAQQEKLSRELEKKTLALAEAYTPAVKAPAAEAVEIDTEDAEGYYQQGLIYNKKGQYGQAISYYTKAIEIDPAYVEAYFNKAVACDNVDRPEEALSAYRDFVQYASPDNYASKIEYAKERIMVLGN